MPSLSSEDAVAVAAVTEVWILMIYTHSEFMVKQKWFLDTRFFYKQPSC